jgi:TolB protein
MRRIGLIISAWVALLAIPSISCSDQAPPDSYKEDPQPLGFSVSNPLVKSTASASLASSHAAASTTDPLAYVSVAPGTYPDAFEGSIQNETTKTSSTNILLRNGGFDPVGVPAESGDELSITIYHQGSGPTVVTVKVPSRRPPHVVRTNPAKGRIDVALSISVEVVFTEPVDRSTVSATSLSLAAGNSKIPGSVTVSDDGLTAQFVPASPLSPGVTYVLSMSQAIHDLDGDPLTDAPAVDFTTAKAPGNIIASATTTVADGAGIDPDGYSVQLDGSLTQHVDANGEVSFDAVTAGRHELVLSGLAINCTESTSNVRTVDVAPGATVRLGFEIACAPAAKLDGMLAFVSERDGNPEIYVGNSDGTGILRLTSDTAVDDEPVWSPDGQRIAFVSRRSGHSDIYIMNPDGSNVVRRTNDGENTSPAWSPDGTRIAFSSLRDGEFKIYVTQADGPITAPTLVSFSTGWNAYPAWSPDGRKIAFTSDWRAYDFLYDVYVTSLTDMSITPLLVGPFFYVDGLKFFFQPSWSPDGTKLAVVTCGKAYDTCYEGSTIAIANADGSDLTDVATSKGYSRPVWSPDGRTLLFSTVSCSECTRDGSIRYVTTDRTKTGVLIPNAYNVSLRPQK